MHSRIFWETKVRREAQEHGFNQGFQLLYCPWSTLDSADTVFLSLNPGKPPEKKDQECIEDRRGNTYEVERNSTKSPLTGQFIALCKFLGKFPSDVLTGVATPYRSNNWRELNRAQRHESLAVGEAFWREALPHRPRRLIIACSSIARDMVYDIYDVAPQDRPRGILSGWGNTRLRRYDCRNGPTIVALPHLSRFTLVGKKECETALCQIFSN